MGTAKRNAHARQTAAGDTHEATKRGGDFERGGAQPQGQINANMGAVGNGILRGQTTA